jgi:DNA segregation ATPase FtsK/SpoIIIE, S-DNA-T family
LTTDPVELTKHLGDVAHLDDAEVHVVEPDLLGGPVDPPDEPRTLYGTIVDSHDHRRPPVIPAWLRNREQRRAFARHFRGLVGYHVAFHTVRSPKYAAKTLVFAPWGALLLAGRQIRWWWHPELSSLMQQAVSDGDVGGGLSTDARLRSARLWRGMVLGAELGGLTCGGVVVAGAAPSWAQALTAAAALPVLARAGRPADSTIVDRTRTGPRFVKLTAEMVRNALVNAGIGVKEPGSLRFPAPGIHRDGPGWLARVDLPAGMVAVKAIEARENLSSALRLPVDQVWPARGPDHAGQLDLWVGYLPVSKMGRPTWSLARPNARTSVFEENEFATDERQRPVRTVLFERNFLIGGVPGSGKTYAGRAVVSIGMLDPICELKIAEFKGVGDFIDLQHLCSTYIVGIDDQSLDAGEALVEWGLAEAERRGRRILAAKQRGEAPEGKVTPELAARPGSGLHPVMIAIDEAHELFLYSKSAGESMERLIKRGRALNLIVVLMTQLPDAKSVPPGITRSVNLRWCLAVMDHIANDQILGTGAYKRGDAATGYRPGDDAGWGITAGIPRAKAARSHFPDDATWKAMVARATQLRGATPVGGREEQVLTRDLVADALAMFAPGDRGLHWQTLAERLADQLPEAYPDVTADAISAWLRSRGIDSVDVKFAGASRMGCRREQLQQALAGRS